MIASFDVGYQLVIYSHGVGVIECSGFDGQIPTNETIMWWVKEVYAKGYFVSIKPLIYVYYYAQT